MSRDNKYPPSLPEFRELCFQTAFASSREEIQGSVERAIADVGMVKQGDDHFLYELKRSLTYWEWRHLGYEQLRSRLRANVQMIKARMMRNQLKLEYHRIEKAQGEQT